MEGRQNKLVCVIVELKQLAINQLEFLKHKLCFKLKGETLVSSSCRLGGFSYFLYLLFP